jgi:hypothetical protein
MGREAKRAELICKFSLKESLFKCEISGLISSCLFALAEFGSIGGIQQQGGFK